MTGGGNTTATRRQVEIIKTRGIDISSFRPQETVI
jgi:hypothetical protein